MAFGTKTNERPGTRATVKYLRTSAYKAREVIDEIRGKDVADADAFLQFCERDIAFDIRKCLASAVANAAHNDELDPETLYVSACYADEGTTIKRWRPRARGRATRIRKRTCHITIIVSPLPLAELDRRARRDEAKAASSGGARKGGRTAAASRAARVARSRQAAGTSATTEAQEAERSETGGAAPGGDPNPSVADATAADTAPAEEIADAIVTDDATTDETVATGTADSNGPDAEEKS